MISYKILKQKKVLDRLYKEKHILEDECEENDNESNQLRLEEKLKEINSFIEDDFAKVVFDYYKRKNPVLYEYGTDRKVEWNQAFGEEFSMVSKTLKHSLVGLATGEGRYRLKK